MQAEQKKKTPSRGKKAQHLQNEDHMVQCTMRTGLKKNENSPLLKKPKTHWFCSLPTSHGHILLSGSRFKSFGAMGLVSADT